MNEEETRETLKTMKENIDKKYLKTRNSEAIETILNLLEKKDIDIIETKEANRQLSVELKKKDKIIDELSTMVFDSRNLTFVDDKQFKDRKKEIIKYAEEQATGKAM